MRKINEYFFGDEEISLHDSLWFYGFYTLVIIILLFTFLGVVL